MGIEGIEQMTISGTDEPAEPAEPTEPTTEPVNPGEPAEPAPGTVTSPDETEVPEREDSEQNGEE